MKVKEEENIQVEKEEEEEEIELDIPKEEELCRICFIQTDTPLFHPCKCNGTMKFVHENCLMNWINVKKSNTCDICHHEFAFSSGKIILFYFQNTRQRLLKFCPFFNFLLEFSTCLQI
jgi:E3 ubiquitin-protein ligase DOA10